MKSKMAWVWFVTTVALAALLFIETRQSGERKQKLEELQIQVENRGKDAAKVQELEQDRMKLRGQLQAVESELNSTRLAYSTLAQMTNAPVPGTISKGGAATAGGSKPAGVNFFGEMLKDPAMKKAMEQQQKIAMDMLYGSLVKKLQLTPEQEKDFKQILLDQQMSNISQAGTMLDPANTNRTEMMQSLRAENEKRQAQIKELLGDEKYSQFQDYNQTMGERMMLDQFGKQVDLNADQTDQLLNIMKEEKKNAQVNQGAPQYDPTKDWQQVFSDPSMAEQLFTQQEVANQRVLERAGQILTPEQVQKLGPVLQNQLEMQKAGMKMARQMFGGGSETSGAGASPAPVPAK